MNLQHYKFRELLKFKGSIYKSEIKEIDEFKTSMCCHNCKNENRNLGSSKIYKCVNCKIEIDRDINASINISRL